MPVDTILTFTFYKEPHGTWPEQHVVPSCSAHNYSRFATGECDWTKI